ncbi:MAG: DUF11 domain-containing protein [Planctomycetaceae bacterium]|nr:DUF11 domain-containing protein [Planctomycetaceae bacterium]
MAVSTAMLSLSAGCATGWRSSSTETKTYSTRSPVELEREQSPSPTEARYPGTASMQRSAGYPTSDPFLNSPVDSGRQTTPVPPQQAVASVPVHPQKARAKLSLSAFDESASDDEPSDGSSGIVLTSFEQPVETERSSVSSNRFSQSSIATPSKTAGVVRMSGSRMSGSRMTGFRGSASVFQPAPPRMPVLQPGCPDPAEMLVGPNGMEYASVPVSPNDARPYPEEFIFDGGDRDIPVHYRNGEMGGLETEDTVAEFRNHLGENRVHASNRVAIYAPRFGAVETVSGPGVDVQVDRAVGAHDVAAPGGLQDERGMQTSLADTQLFGFNSRRSASGVERAETPVLSEHSQSVLESNKFDHGAESRSSSGPGILQRTSIVELSVRITDAARSTNYKGVSAASSTTQAMVTYATFKVQATVGTEMKGRPGEVVLTKEASSLVAAPGDVITFRIQFTNTGDLNVGDVRIIDNLTPRLRYVAGSGQIVLRDGQVGGNLSVVPNSEGSEVLEFTLDQPLQGGESGVVTFEAEVR